MELALSSLPYLLSSLLLLLLAILFLQKKLKHSKSKLPPGPWTLPFIGSLHHLATAGLPHHALRDLARSYGSLMHLRVGGIDLIVVTSREAAKEVMKTQDAKFANRPAMCAAKILLYGASDIAFSNGPYWRQLRRICSNELFSSKRVKSFSSIRQEEINSMLKSFSLLPEKSSVNLSEKASELSNNITIRAAFGGKCKNKRILLEVLRELLEHLGGYNLSDLFPSLSWLDVSMRRKLTRLRCKLDLVLEEILQEHLKRRASGEEEEFEYDLVDVLINVMEGGDLEEPLTMDNIKAVILDLFLGGTESSSTTIIWAMTELIKNPEVMAKVQAEIKKAQSENTKFDHNTLSYLKLVIKETLRMHPVGPLLAPRECKESCKMLGYTIPSKATLVVNAWALGRNPDYWIDPEEFKPERFETSEVDFKGQNFEFVPFGAGRRICPGLEFGMAVLEEALGRLLFHFDWRLPDGLKPDDMDMTETYGLTATKKEPLYLIPTLRVPLPDV